MPKGVTWKVVLDLCFFSRGCTQLCTNKIWSYIENSNITYIEIIMLYIKIRKTLQGRGDLKLATKYKNEFECIEEALEKLCGKWAIPVKQTGKTKPIQLARAKSSWFRLFQPSERFIVATRWRAKEGAYQPRIM